MDGRIDGRKDGWTDGQTLSYSGEDASRIGKLPQTGIWEKGGGGGGAVPISRNPNDLKFGR